MSVRPADREWLMIGKIVRGRSPTGHASEFGFIHFVFSQRHGCAARESAYARPVCSPVLSDFVRKRLADMLEASSVARSECCIILSCSSEREFSVGPASDHLGVVVVLAIVFPKTHLAYLVPAAPVQRLAPAAGASIRLFLFIGIAHVYEWFRHQFLLANVSSHRTREPEANEGSVGCVVGLHCESFRLLNGLSLRP